MSTFAASSCCNWKPARPPVNACATRSRPWPRPSPPTCSPCPGVSAMSAVTLFAETDPISTFTCADALVAYAGLDPTVYQSGDYDAPRRRISKRGSPHLRRTLWLMAMATIMQPGPLRDYYRRRREGGLHHTSAVTAVALKLCRITWRIMTDQRDYTPEPPATKGDASITVKNAAATTKRKAPR